MGYVKDGYKCRYCGTTASETELTVDHVRPVALGGTDDPSNLATACTDCNSGKAATSPDQEIVENVADDALRWGQAMREAAEIKASQKQRRDSYIAAFDHEWCSWRFVGDESASEIERPGDWRDSIARFYELGLEIELLFDFIAIVMGKRSRGTNEEFRYFCGCCWEEIRQRQEIAQALITKEDSDR